MPLFSVIVPTHNRSKLLLQTLKSVKDQIFSDYEVIVVNDCSTDDTLAVLKSASFPIKIVDLKEPSRVSRARNAGLDAATGEYIALLDDDDLWLPWTLSTYAAVIERHDRPAQLSSNGATFAQPSDLDSINREPLQDWLLPDYLTYVTNPNQPGWNIPTGNVIRRDIALSRRFDPDLTNHEDEDMWLQLGTAPGYVRIIKPLCWGYRSYPSSAAPAQLSANLSARFDSLHELIRKERAGLYPGGAARRRERWKVIAQIGRVLARLGARGGYGREAWRLYLALLPWNVKLLRARFLTLFPAELLWGSMVGSRLARLGGR